jgi:hypothetical protein
MGKFKVVYIKVAGAVLGLLAVVAAVSAGGSMGP